MIEIEGGRADVPFTATASREERERERSGRLAADRIRFGQADEGLAVEHPAAALEPTDSGFALAVESGELGGGTLEGSGELGLLQRGWPFRLDLRLAAAEPSRIAGALGFGEEAISGDPLAGAVQVSGQLAAPQTWEGEFRLRTERLIIDPAAAANAGADFRAGERRASGSERSVRAAQVLDFRPARVEVRLEGGLVRLTDALLHADGVALRGNGWVMLDGHLALAARLYLDESYAAGAARLLASLQPDRPPGLVAFPPTSLVYREFGLAGTLTEPEMYLWTDAPPLPVDRLLGSVRAWLAGGDGWQTGADRDAGASAEPEPEP